MKLKLSHRLQAVASYINQNARIADVGTDHGFIPVYLVENGITKSAIASDLREMPLENAKKAAGLHHVDQYISFRLSNGLLSVSPDECDTIIMAGMGGNTIREIITDSAWAKEKHLILQPQTQIADLRFWLFENGITVRDASLAQDCGRFYVVWDCVPGQETKMPDAFDRICDPMIVAKDDELLVPFTESIRKKYLHILNGLKNADSTNDQQVNDVLSVIERANGIIQKKA